MSKRRVFLLLLLLIFIELLNSQTWYELYIEGRKMILNGQFQTGIQKLLLATKVKPNSQLNARIYGMNFIDYIPYFYIGYAYFHLKNYSNAKDYLEKELELGVIRGLAKEYSQLNDLLNKVREYLSKSDKREGKIENTASSEARNEAVGISEYEKRFKDAMKLKAELKYTECIEALDSLAKDVLRIEHSKRNELLAEIYFQIGMCYFFQNNEELVIESFKKIFNYSPDYDIDREVYSERVVKLFDRAKEVYRRRVHF
jgi:tetratricopeptide (TPR) repeat protein